MGEGPNRHMSYIEDLSYKLNGIDGKYTGQIYVSGHMENVALSNVNQLNNNIYQDYVLNDRNIDSKFIKPHGEGTWEEKLIKKNI